MITNPPISGWSRSIDAVEKVKERTRRSARALDAAGVPYAVVGGNAVAEWVERMDEGAARNTRNVDLLIDRSNLRSVQEILESCGFILREPAIFADGIERITKADVQLLFAGESMKPDDAFPHPELMESERFRDFQVVSLLPLVRMKLVAKRRIDLVHLRDMIGVGLIDASWPARFPPPLADRLQQLLDDPDG